MFHAWNVVPEMMFQKKTSSNNDVSEKDVVVQTTMFHEMDVVSRKCHPLPCQRGMGQAGRRRDGAAWAARAGTPGQKAGDACPNHNRAAADAKIWRGPVARAMMFHAC